jgi:hypothetical protein
MKSNLPISLFSSAKIRAFDRRTPSVGAVYLTRARGLILRTAGRGPSIAKVNRQLRRGQRDPIQVSSTDVCAELRPIRDNQ